MADSPPAGAGSPGQAGQPRWRGHPGAWIAWAVAGAGIALLSRNPWQLLIVGAAALAARWRLSGKRPGRSDAVLFAGLLAFPTLLNFALSRTGSTVLWHLPLPWIGGNFTLEALLFGGVAGIQIATLLAVMMAFGAAVSSTDLLRRVPSGLYPVGLTASIGLTFAPQARRTFHQIREAQEVRGFRARGWRDLPQLIVPMVVMSLENALALGESLASRGWGQSRLGTVGRWGMVSAWLLLASGLVLWLVAPGLAWLSLVSLGAGLGVFVGLGRAMGRPNSFSAGHLGWTSHLGDRPLPGQSGRVHRRDVAAARPAGVLPLPARCLATVASPPPPGVPASGSAGTGSEPCLTTAI